MSAPTPSPTVTEIAKAKPKLVIFDDDSILLQRFVGQYRALGYDVTSVLVASGNNDNLFLGGGRIKQHDIPDDAGPQDPENPTFRHLQRSVQGELQDAKADLAANPNRAYLKTSVALYSAMAEFDHGVLSKPEARALLETLQPDCVLSDLSMRRFGDYDDMTPQERAADPDTIMGTDIMAMAREVVPHAACAIHSGEYSKPETFPRPVHRRAEANLIRAKRVGHASGYTVYPKDREDEPAKTCDKVHAHFTQHHRLSAQQSACDTGHPAL